MPETLAQKLTVGGKSNSLGRAEEVVQEVLRDKSRLDELYNCLFEDDAWLRMRAADSVEKVCRVHPEWFKPYVERLFSAMMSGQPSLQWHLAQMLGEIELTSVQREKAVEWLCEKVNTTETDWIVASNAMKTLSQFAHEGFVSKEKLIPLFEKQLLHHSNSVQKKATKFLEAIKKLD